VTQLYANVLHRALDANGSHSNLDGTGTALRATLIGFSGNQAALIGVIQNGMEFT
jgi:hypothetical protein